MMNERKAVPSGSTGKIDLTRIPQHTKLQIGAIFYKALYPLSVDNHKYHSI